MAALLATSTAAQAAEFIATEVAWNGSASDGWIAAKLAEGGFEVDANAVAAFAVEAGLLRPIPRLGGYSVTRKVNARTFGRKFAEWVAA
jgi:hypothetical protein